MMRLAIITIVVLMCGVARGSDFLMVRPLMDSPQTAVPVTPAAPGTTGPVRQFFQNIFGSAPTQATPAPVAAAPYAATPPSVVMPATPAPAYTTPAPAPVPVYTQPVAVAPPVVAQPKPKSSCCPNPFGCGNVSNNCSPSVNFPGCSPQTNFGTPTVICPNAMVPQTVVIAPGGY